MNNPRIARNAALVTFATLSILCPSEVVCADAPLQWQHITDGPGGGSCDIGKAITVGPDGNIYYTGQGAVSTSGCSDVYIESLTPDGTVNWSYNYNGGAFDIGYAIDLDDDGNVYVAAESNVSGGNRFTVVSVDAAGNFRWVYNWAGTGPWHAAFDVAVGPDGNVYACGISSTVLVEDTESLFAVALNSDGVELWKYSYPVFGGLSHGAGRAIAVDEASNVYVAGTTGSQDAVVVGLNSLGIQLWTYLHNGSAGGADDYADMVLGGDGNLYAAGRSDELGRSRDLLATSLTTAGVVRWTYLYDGSSSVHDLANAITWGSDGNVYVGGKTVEGGEDPMTVISLTPDGTERWVALPVYNGFNGVQSITTDSQHNVIAAGWIQSTAALNYGVQCLSMDGDLLWTYTSDSGIGNADGVAVDADDNIYVVGNVNGGGPLATRLVVTSFRSASVNVPVPEARTPLSLQSGRPNPFHNATEIRFSLERPDHVRLVVHDVTGRHVVTLIDGQRAGGEHAHAWDGRDSQGRRVASGTYLYRLTVGGQTVARTGIALR